MANKQMARNAVARMSFNPSRVKVHLHNPEYTPISGRFPCTEFVDEQKLRAMEPKRFFALLHTQHLDVPEGTKKQLVYNQSPTWVEVRVILDGQPVGDMRKYWFSNQGGPRFFDLIEAPMGLQPAGKATLYWLVQTKSFFCDTCESDFEWFAGQKMHNLCSACRDKAWQKELEEKAQREASTLDEFEVVTQFGEPATETQIAEALKQGIEGPAEAGEDVPPEQTEKAHRTRTKQTAAAHA